MNDLAVAGERGHCQLGSRRGPPLRSSCISLTDACKARVLSKRGILDAIVPT